MIYIGGGFVCVGSSGYEDGDDVVDPPEWDEYDEEFQRPVPGKTTKGESPVRRAEERSREFPQFAKKYAVDIDQEKLREALGWLVTRADTLGDFRYDDIVSAHGEIAGTAYWIGFGPDATPGMVHDGLLEAFRQVGVDISQTLIGHDNLRRGLERSGGEVKETFFRLFLPDEGWKLTSDWTLLRENEKRADARPEIQEQIRERQRDRRLEIIQALKDIHQAERHAAELAAAEAARQEAEARAEALAKELEAARLREAQRAPRAPEAPQKPIREELRAIREEIAQIGRALGLSGWRAAAARSKQLRAANQAGEREAQAIVARAERAHRHPRSWVAAAQARKAKKK